MNCAMVMAMWFGEHLITEDDITNGKVEITVPTPENDGDYEYVADITDPSGDTGPRSNEVEFELDTTAAEGTVTVANITEDDVLNAKESGETIAVMGTATGGDISEGDVVTMTINGQSYETTVNQGGSWSVVVEGSDLAADTAFEVIVTSSDPVGNTVESKETSTHTVDTKAGDTNAAPTVTITEDSNPADGVISETELVGDIDVSVGLPAGAVKGDTITVSDGTTSTPIVLTDADILAGNVTTTFPSPGEGNEIKVTATLSDQYGNTSEEGSDKATVDTKAGDTNAAPTVTITEDSNPADGVISETELVGDIDVSVGLPAGAVKGDTITVSDGTTSTPIVLTDADILAGNVTTTFPSPGEGNEIKVTATLSDQYGNTSEEGSDKATVDTKAGDTNAAPTVTITEDSNPADGVISETELVGDIDVSVGLPAGAVKGDTITVSDGTTSTPIVLTDADILAGNVTTTFPSPGEGNEIKVTATLSDQYGNTSEEGSDKATVDTKAGDTNAAPTVTITEDSNPADGVISETELVGDIDVSVGLPAGAVKGDTITVSDGTTSTPIVLTDADILAGNVTTTFPSPGEGNEIKVTATLSDQYGNTSEEGSDKATVDTKAGDTNAAPTVTITEDSNPADGVISETELVGDIDVSVGLPAGAVKGDTITVSDGTTSTPIVLTDADILAGNVTTTFPSPGEGNEIKVTATLSDQYGNTSEEGSDKATVDTKVNGLTSDITNNTNTGLNSDTVTNNTMPDITGITEAGAKVTITYTDKDGLIHTTNVTTANESGEYTISLTHELNEGSNSLIVTAVDIAGNKAEIIQDVTINTDPIADDFEIKLTDGISTQFSFEPHVSDLEDDASDTDNKFVDITITDSPEFGTLYLVDGETRTEITSSTVLTESDQIEYVLDESINEDLSFNAKEDFSPNYSNGSVNSFTLASGVIISGGQFTGNSPDETSTLTPESLHYDNVEGETGLGVGNSEIDVSEKDYIEVDFTNVGSSSTTDVAITEVNIDFGSVWGNYSENSNANAQVQVLLFKDGVLVGESPYTFDDENNGIYDGTGEFTANIQLDSGFDQIRVYTTHGEGSTSSNSNLTLQGVEVVDATVSEDIHYQATDSDDAIDTGVITISTDSTDNVTNNAPTVNDLVFNATDEDVAISLNLNDLEIIDLDGDDAILTSITVDPAFGSLNLIFNGDEVIGATFTPAENKHFDSNSPVEFTVTVSDGHKSSTGIAELIVNAQADKPTVSLVLGEPVLSNVSIDSTIHDKLINGYSLTQEEQNAIGVNIDSIEVAGIERRVIGDEDNEQIIGTDLADILLGGAGDDLFIGGAGDDKIDGDDSTSETANDGYDTVVYSRSINDYTILNHGDAGGSVDKWAVYDSRGIDSSPNVTGDWDANLGDHLYEIERIIFSDAIVELNPDGTYTILQDVEIPLDLSASVTDLDGSESLESLTLSGLSENAIILDENKQPIGTYDQTTGDWVLPIDSGNQAIDFSNLTIQIPKSESDFILTATATAIDGANPNSSSSSAEATLPQDIFVDQGGSLPTTLITLALDSSGSMDDVEVDGKERMQLVLESSIKLLEDVQSQPNSGTVKVQLVDFDNDYSDSQRATSLGWYTIADAIDVLQNAIVIEDSSDPYNVGGGTDYSEAIYAIFDGYSNDNIPNDIDLSNTNDVIYFISDGYNGNSWATQTLDDWAEFTKDKEVKAIGVVNDGTNNPYLGGLTEISDDVIYIEDKELYTVLPQLKPTIGQQGALTGSLVGIVKSEIVIEAAKLDVLKIIDQDGNISSESAGINIYEGQIQIVTEYGNLLISKDGSYIFQPIDNPTIIDGGKSVTYELAYTVIDTEGIEHFQQATLNVSPSDEANMQIGHSLSGSTNDDVVIGSENDDIILSHQGNDILIGGLGDDILVGGTGEDIFKWVDQGSDSGTDTIKDFTVGEDLIDLIEIIGGDDDVINMEDLLSHITVSEEGNDLTLSITDDAGNAHDIVVEGAVTSFGLEDANFSNQSEILTKLLNDQMFKLDDIT
ncbi:Ig-like domain-containing protein [Aliivibrio wodanis]|uniref:Ig-like domain-containing protein n=1 Tax=Aliivibrio wodanis TaxID=80852 RepID=UPI00406CEE57